MVLRNMIVFILVYACYRPTSFEKWDIFLLEALKIYYFDPCPLADTWHMWWDEIGTALNTSSAENGSVLKALLPPLPQGELAKETATSWKVETYQHLKQNTWYLQIFLGFFFFPVHWFVFSISLLCPSFPPGHRLSASIRPSTHRRSLSKRSMPGISSHCVSVCVLWLFPSCVCSPLCWEGCVRSRDQTKWNLVIVYTCLLLQMQCSIDREEASSAEF